MPNQITYTITRTIRPDDGGTDRGDKLINRQYTQTDEGLDDRRINVGTSEETLTLNADITTKGQTWIHNQSQVAGNKLLVGNATGSYMHEIPPGEAELFWLKSGTTIYWKFSTSADWAQIHCEGA